MDLTRRSRLPDRAALVLLFALAPAGCAELDGPDGSRASGEVRRGEPAALTGTVTVEGRVFYNDRRGKGHFDRRWDPDGNQGQQCGPDGVRGENDEPCHYNYLGAYRMVVDVIERDTGYPVLASGCEREDRLLSVSVQPDGEFSATFAPTDPCEADDWSLPRIELRVRTRYCGSWCASFNTSWDDPYALDHPNATYDQPLAVSSGSSYDVGDMYFALQGGHPLIADDYSITANLYASLVDTIETVHTEHGVPFYESEFGEVQYIYPSSGTDSGTTRSESEVELARIWEWPDSGIVAHEYGHVLMLRAWGGHYGYDGYGTPWGPGSPQPKRIAFKEGWANFIERSILSAGGCGGDSFDDNKLGRALPGELGEGSEWVVNVWKLLCDWYDASPADDDDDSSLAGAGDHFAEIDFYSMWFNLRNMYVRRSEYGGDYAEGLWICDWVDYFLNVRKSASAVGQFLHDYYVDEVTDLIFNNNIGCFLPTPPGS